MKNDNQENLKAYIKENIIAWYPFKKGSKILQIIINDEDMFEFANNQDYYVKVVNLKPNNCFVKLKSIEIQEEFDYILLIGSYEYSSLFFETKNPYSDLLLYLKGKLKDDGKIILAINNRFGIKYFCGAKSKHYDKIFDSITNDIDLSKSNLLSKNEIIQNIENAKFDNYKFYYPVPDYRMVNSIFTDDFLPKDCMSKLVYQLYYNKDSIILYNEIQAIKQICKSDLFEKMCNSYLVEISNEKIDNDIKFVSYNNLRKDEYTLMLVMHENQVFKYAIDEKGKEHIENIKSYIKQLKELGFKVLEKIEDDTIISDFIEYEELDKIIINLIKRNEKEKALEEITKWYKYICEKISTKDNMLEDNIFKKFNIEVDTDLLQKMNITKYGFIDLCFENVFLDSNDEYLLYDQEWYFENIPIEFILYRAINNLYCYNENDISKFIDIDKMLEKFEIIQYKEIFNKLEKNIQETIIDKNKINYYIDIIPPIEKIENLYKRTNDALILEDIKSNLEKENAELLQNNRDISDKYNKLEFEYNSLIQSKSYKVMKAIRKVLKGK